MNRRTGRRLAADAKTSPEVPEHIHYGNGDEPDDARENDRDPAHCHERNRQPISRVTLVWQSALDFLGHRR
jgi:hypothetical protein